MNDLARYNSVKHMLQTGDLLLWKSDSLLGEAIRLFSKANVNHASLVFQITPYEGSEHRRFTSEALEHGVVLNLLSKRLAEFGGEVWWYPLNADMSAQRIAIGERALQYLGTPYDYEALFQQAVERVKADPEKLFCSEYCFLCYGLEGIAPRPGDMPALGLFSEPLKIVG